MTQSGGHSEEVPPVPIPNTVVKLLSVENTWRATARENRTLPEQINGRSEYASSVIHIGYILCIFSQKREKLNNIFLGMIFLYSSVGRAHDC